MTGILGLNAQRDALRKPSLHVRDHEIHLWWLNAPSIRLWDLVVGNIVWKLDSKSDS
jgi:hypothetical protein